MSSGIELLTFLIFLCESISPILQDYTKSSVYDMGSNFIKKLLEKKKVDPQRLIERWFVVSIKSVGRGKIASKERAQLNLIKQNLDNILIYLYNHIKGFIISEDEFISILEQALKESNIHVSKGVVQSIGKSFISQLDEEVSRNKRLFAIIMMQYIRESKKQIILGQEEVERIKELINKWGEEITKITKFFGIPQDKFLPSRMIWPPVWLGWREEKPDLWEYYSGLHDKLISKELPFMVLLRFNKPLREEDVVCQKLNLKFVSREDLVYRREAIKTLLESLGRKLFNSICARLYNYEYDEKHNKLKLIFQPVEYFDTLHTNHYCDLLYKDWQSSTRDILAPGPSLTPLEKSECGNDLGVNLILELSDGFIVLQRRSFFEAIHPNKLGPSVSAAMEYKFNTPFESIRDEVNLELGLLQDEMKDIQLVGLGRDLERAGKPEAFFIGKSSVGREMLKKYFMEKRGQEYWELYEENPFEFIHRSDYERIREIINTPSEPPITRAALWFWLKTVTS